MLGSTPGIIVGVGVGTAVSAAIEPALEVAKQEAWSRLPNRVNDPGLIARLVAQGGIELGARDGSDDGTAYDAALRHGFTADKLDQAIYLAQTVPTRGEARELWRRKFMDDALWTHSLRKEGLDSRYFEALNKTYWDILSPEVIANAIHRDLIADPGLLVGDLPLGPGKVTPYPRYDIPALAEAEGSGINRDRLGVLVGLVGNPMGPHEAAQAVFRKIIDYNDYLLAIAQGNTRQAWADAIYEHAKQIPTARDFMENALRGHHDFDWAAEQAARHGMERDDAFVIYQNQGRPLNLHQISQAIAWGGTYNPGPGDNADPWMQAVLLGAVRPEYYDLQKHLKYIVPSTFAIRTLAETKVWGEEKVAARLKQAGWIPEDADEVAKAWTTPTAATAKPNPYQAKADNQLWTALHKAYVDRGAQQSDVDPMLQVLVPDDATRLAIFSTWDVERDADALTAPAP